MKKIANSICILVGLTISACGSGEIVEDPAINQFEEQTTQGLSQSTVRCRIKRATGDVNGITWPTRCILSEWKNGRYGKILGQCSTQMQPWGINSCNMSAGSFQGEYRVVVPATPDLRCTPNTKSGYLSPGQFHVAAFDCIEYY